MTPDLLRQQLAEVARLRAVADNANAWLKAKREEFEASISTEVQSVNVARAALAESESNARALIVAIYETSGDKKPAEGASVRLTTKLTYTDEDALAWAREKKMALIPESVDRKALEKIAKVTPLPFVTITEEPSATLASDLSQYLAPVEVPVETPVESAEAPF